MISTLKDQLQRKDIELRDLALQIEQWKKDNEKLQNPIQPDSNCQHELELMHKLVGNIKLKFGVHLEFKLETTQQLLDSRPSSSIILWVNFDLKIK